MARMIEDENLIKYIKSEEFAHRVIRSKDSIRDILIEVINEQPTVDAVEVVRCKDCKYRNTEDCGMLYECMRCGGQWAWEYDNGYCSFGEKMDGG